MANLVSRDLRLVEESAVLSAWCTNQQKLKQALVERELVEVETENKWRVPYLAKQRTPLI